MNKSVKDPWVLIIEDERPLLGIIQERFEQHNIETVTARSCEQALEYLGSIGCCNAIWLDHYLLGGKTGYDFLAALKADKNLEAIPVFVVTNSGLHDKERTYLSLGAKEYFVKANHKLKEIVTAICQHVENSKSTS